MEQYNQSRLRKNHHGKKPIRQTREKLLRKKNLSHQNHQEEIHRKKNHREETRPRKNRREKTHPRKTHRKLRMSELAPSFPAGAI
jgi:hypothetical protein